MKYVLNYDDDFFKKQHFKVNKCGSKLKTKTRIKSLISENPELTKFYSFRTETPLAITLRR